MVLGRPAGRPPSPPSLMASLPVGRVGACHGLRTLIPASAGAARLTIIRELGGVGQNGFALGVLRLPQCQAAISSWVCVMPLS
jgi:hypothetical protein